MSRLIVVSNRVQSPRPQGGAQGGLAVALTAALREKTGFWFGWSGRTTDNFQGDMKVEEYNGVRTVTVDLEEQDFDEYYNGYANNTLWPVFHYRIDLAEYERSYGSGYERVNLKFSELLSPMVEPDDTVWVHDYHMIPMAWDLRRKGIKNRIGFFLHTPWPPTRLLTALPHHRRLVTSLFAYDVVGFQTQEWLESFLHYCEQELGATVSGDRVTFNGRTIVALACPIGIDFDEFHEGCSSSAASRLYRQMRASLQHRSLIVGVDRLDYSKGLEERFYGFERFLVDHPEAHRNLVMVQIAPPSRAAIDSYKIIRTKLDAEAGRINGALSHVDWTPIRYVNKGYQRDELAGIYRAARIGLVTPLRDGMNLVAKEFVAAQDPENPGVLILSRFAGASQQLSDAVLINPYSAEEMSDAIGKAMAMPLSERVSRHRSLLQNVREQDVVWWRKKYLSVLEAVETTNRQLLPDTESAQDIAFGELEA